MIWREYPAIQAPQGSEKVTFNILVETRTTELTSTRNPQDFAENQDIAKFGGNVAGDARKAIEKESDCLVITSENDAYLNTVVITMIEIVTETTETDDIE